MSNSTTKSLDAVDRRILQALQNDGRLTATDLAERAGITTSPCLRRLRLLEESRIIYGYTALVDQAKVGLPISVFVSIKLERQSEDAMERFETAVRRCPEVRLAQGRMPAHAAHEDVWRFLSEQIGFPLLLQRLQPGFQCGNKVRRCAVLLNERLYGVRN